VCVHGSNTHRDDVGGRVYPAGALYCPELFLNAYRSAWNRTGVTQRLWTNSNCTGSNTIILNGEALANLSAHYSIGGYP
jgi:hypothetical protein